MGRRSRSPAGQGAEEGPRLCALGLRGWLRPGPRTRPSLGRPPPLGQANQRAAAHCLTEQPGGGVESGERESLRAGREIRAGNKEWSGCVCVRVSAPALRRSFWVRGPCCDSPRPRGALHCRLPALARTNFILGKLLFLFPSSSAPTFSSSFSRLNASGEGKPKLREGHKL